MAAFGLKNNEFEIPVATYLLYRASRKPALFMHFEKSTDVI